MADFDIERAKELIARRDAIDAELADIFGGAPRTTARKPQKCGKCGEEGHSARTCPQGGETESKAPGA